ncbi:MULTISPECIES: hypothetical protein [unclassified Leucobacter]|uniref:hypothetical protein n=1 Tax=unclassified Leucobacter TaxID=2621730 RepID=UPI000A913B42|nr:hypothetical protein [Leucobacter sp. Ag1]
MQWGWNPDSVTAVATLLAAAAALGAVVVFRWRKKDKAEAARNREEDRDEQARLREEDRAENERLRSEDKAEFARIRQQDLDVATGMKQETIACGIRARWVILRDGALESDGKLWGIELCNSNDFSASHLVVECTQDGASYVMKLDEVPPGIHFRPFTLRKAEQGQNPWELPRLIRDSDIWDVVTSPKYRVNTVTFVYGRDRFVRRAGVALVVERLGAEASVE